MLKFNSIVIGFLINKLFSLNHATNFTILTFESLDSDFNFLVTSFNCDINVFKSKTPREILIQNSYLALSVITSKSFIICFIIQLNKEIKIWLPFIIINNWNLNQLFIFISFKLDHSISMFVIFWWSSCSSNSSVSNLTLAT